MPEPHRTNSASPKRSHAEVSTDNRAGEALLEVLVEMQHKHGGLTPELVTDAARQTKTSPSHAYGVASFYSMLSFQPQPRVIRVCDGPTCWLRGSSATRRALEATGSDWHVERSSCLGLCDRAPAALVNEDQAGPVLAGNAPQLLDGWRSTPSDFSQSRPGELRVMMAGAGQIDPDSIDSALQYGAYEGFRAAMKLTPEAVIELVTASRLQGRGGAGFPVGRKWTFVAQAPRKPKYIVCNADESEPLLFKDRVLIETNPHQLLEGIMIGGYACGASDAWIYIRGEYGPQARSLRTAIKQAEEHGLLGDNILGTDFSFRIHVHQGAGAYICGEETALLESLEGNRGEPRLRPPYPPERGFRSMPTAVNNVESFCAVASIFRVGLEKWLALSTYPTPGTKLYMILGHVRQPGLFEAPFGLSLRRVIEEFGGGLKEGSEFHFALCGGAAGTLVDASLLDVPVDYGSAAKGISLGGGAFLVCDKSVSPVALLRELLHFFSVESCGKCTPCRVGTWRSLQILDRMTAGQGWKGDADELSTLATLMQVSSFCGLGQSVAIPMMSALKHFGREFADSETVEPLPVLRKQ